MWSTFARCKNTQTRTRNRNIEELLLIISRYNETFCEDNAFFSARCTKSPYYFLSICNAATNRFPTTRLYSGELIRADKQWQAYVMPSRSKAENMCIDRGLSPLWLFTRSHRPNDHRQPVDRVVYPV